MSARRTRSAGVGETDWVEVAWHLTVVTLWLTSKAILLLARTAALLTVAVLPAANSAGHAVGYAVLTAGAWTLVGGLLGVLSGDGGVALFGLSLGGVVGCIVGYAVFQRCHAQAQAAAGAVVVGERQGVVGVSQPLVIARETRVRHLAVFGATGSGKSTVLKNLVQQDAAAPQRPGLLVVDVKDDLVLDIAAHLPAHRIEDVLLFDPADTEFPPAFNPLAGVPAESRTLAAAELVSALKRLYADAWGPRLEHVLRAVVLTLLETPDATLLDISRILTDPAYRAWAVSHVTNFSVRQFWEHEFPAITGKGGSLANVQSLLNKLGVFAYPEVRNVIGQTQRGLDIRAAMDEGKIVLAHLPQGILGEDVSHFLAALLIGKVQLAAQSRANLAHSERRPFYVFADEFQNYETSAFDKIITEGRSMGVGLVAACQFREQLHTDLRLALEKNCAYALFCRVVNKRHTVEVLKLQELDAPDADLLVRPFPPPRDAHADQVRAIREQSRRRLGQPRAVVEAAIAKRMTPYPKQEPEPQPSASRPSFPPTHRRPTPAPKPQPQPLDGTRPHTVTRRRRIDGNRSGSS